MSSDFSEYLKMIASLTNVSKFYGIKAGILPLFCGDAPVGASTEYIRLFAIPAIYEVPITIPVLSGFNHDSRSVPQPHKPLYTA